MQGPLFSLNVNVLIWLVQEHMIPILLLVLSRLCHQNNLRIGVIRQALCPHLLAQRHPSKMIYFLKPKKSLLKFLSSNQLNALLRKNFFSFFLPISHKVLSCQVFAVCLVQIPYM